MLGKQSTPIPSTARGQTERWRIISFIQLINSSLEYVLFLHIGGEVHMIFWENGAQVRAMYGKVRVQP